MKNMGLFIYKAKIFLAEQIESGKLDMKLSDIEYVKFIFPEDSNGDVSKYGIINCDTLPQDIVDYLNTIWEIC